ncbi:HAD family hydrolase [Haploplasma modicum]|uniref:HAD-IIB family hydrolase n=1 Tax=Haploplasma modicum TaxID=2150 RepID=UPI00214B1ED8|nr:HAD family hydrolase [Haploplasma modicum]MCR1808975.1 Cof-type HAD-IIB family hydrolase [Haploplasma modicum]
MKTIIFFDLDNTIHSTKNQIIPGQTVKLLLELANLPNTYLGIATGRNEAKVSMLGSLLDLFTYKIFINGAIAYKNNELVYNNAINKEEIKNVISLAEKKDISVGFVCKIDEYITTYNDQVHININSFNIKKPEVKPDIYLSEDVYQLWLFTSDKDYIDSIKNQINLDLHPWHKEGYDLVDRKSNKALAIKELLKGEEDYRLIAVGDGHNDIQMVEMADIGIAMSNSGFLELKEKADYIAPHIDDNQLYDFFKSIKILP